MNEIFLQAIRTGGTRGRTLFAAQGNSAVPDREKTLRHGSPGCRTHETDGIERSASGNLRKVMMIVNLLQMIRIMLLVV
ncbi:MAG: hypothetical protein RR215_05025, partial [Ruthenibacterium sp.]